MIDIVLELLEAGAGKLIDFCASLVPSGLPEKRRKVLRRVFAVVAFVMLALLATGIVLAVDSEKTRTAGIVLIAVSGAYFLICLIVDIVKTVRMK